MIKAQTEIFLLFFDKGMVQKEFYGTMVWSAGWFGKVCEMVNSQNNLVKLISIMVSESGKHQ